MGSGRQRREVQHAAAKFYGGMASVAKMLQDYELSGGGQAGIAVVQTDAEQAVGLFNNAAGRYSKAAAMYNAFSNWPHINQESVRALLQSSGGPEFESVIASSKKGPKTLLIICSSSAGRMARSTEEFAAQIKRGPRTLYFSNLFMQLSKTLQIGTVVSAVFAYVGGERSER